MTTNFHGFPVPTDGRFFVSPTPYVGFMDCSRAQHLAGKPRGLWYACGDEWVYYLKNSAGMEHLYEGARYLYQIHIRQSKILMVHTESDLKRLNLNFSAQGEEVQASWQGDEDLFISWPRMAKRFSGVEISPVQYELRDTGTIGWYFGWDVASGCIWKKDAIHSVELLFQR